MNIKKLTIFTISVLVLTACVPKDVPSSSTKVENQQQKPVEKALVSQDELSKISDLEKKFHNPKRATLRFVNTKNKTVAGKVYLQYDKSDKYTYFWLKTPKNELLDPKSDYQISISASPKDVVDLGKIKFDADGNGYAYFKFAKTGNFYKYLHLKVKQDQKDILIANFNPKLS